MVEGGERKCRSKGKEERERRNEERKKRKGKREKEKEKVRGGRSYQHPKVLKNSFFVDK